MGLDLSKEMYSAAISVLGVEYTLYVHGGGILEMLPHGWLSRIGSGVYTYDRYLFEEVWRCGTGGVEERVGTELVRRGQDVVARWAEGKWWTL